MFGSAPKLGDKALEMRVEHLRAHWAYILQEVNDLENQGLTILVGPRRLGQDISLSDHNEKLRVYRTEQL